MVVLSQHTTYVCLDAKKMPVDMLSLSSYSLAPGPPASTGSPRHCIRFCWFARQASKQSLPGFLPEIPGICTLFCVKGACISWIDTLRGMTTKACAYVYRYKYIYKSHIVNSINHDTGPGVPGKFAVKAFSVAWTCYESGVFMHHRVDKKNMITLPHLATSQNSCWD